MRPAIIVGALFFAATAVAAPTITKETLSSGGLTRTYYLFIPESVQANAPLLVLLHGSGRNGRLLLEHWKPLAEKNGIILAGPDATESRQWQFPADGPVFLRDVVRAVMTKVSVDPRRVYLFGHSAGANFAIPQALLQAKFYAAVVGHAGGIQGNEAVLDVAQRKVPIALIAGKRDRALGNARGSEQALKERGFAVELTEIRDHGHDYYGRSKSINEIAWRFLSAHSLDRDPAYISYANIPE